MSKPINEMTNPSTSLRTREELIYALSDILERETDDWGRCRWCRAEEKPVTLGNTRRGVNLAGKAVAPEDADDPWEAPLSSIEGSPEGDEYQIEHEADCAVTYIEAVLGGTYEYVNEPPKA